MLKSYLLRIFVYVAFVGFIGLFLVVSRTRGAKESLPRELPRKTSTTARPSDSGSGARRVPTGTPGSPAERRVSAERLARARLLVSETICRRQGRRSWPWGGIRDGSPDSLAKLVKDPEFQKLRKELEEAGGEEYRSLLLRLIGDAASMESRYLSLALAADSGIPEFLDLMKDQLGNSKDGGVALLSAWGLSRIGSVEALQVLESALKAAFAGHQTSTGVEFCLASAGPAGLDRTLSLARDLAGSGGLTLADIKESARLLEFCAGAEAAARLRELATSDPSPIVRVLALQSMSASGKDESVSFFLNRLQSESDHAVRDALLDTMVRHTLVGRMEPLAPQTRADLARFIEHEQSLPAAVRARAMYYLDPDAYAAVIEQVVLGNPPPGFEAAELVRAMAADVYRERPEKGRELIQKAALGSDLRSFNGLLRPLLSLDRWSDPALVGKLLSVVESDGLNPIVREAALQALSAGPEANRDELMSRVYDLYKTTWQADARGALLSGLAKFGEPGLAIVYKEARDNTDRTQQLLAWNSLCVADTFEVGEVGAQARSFVTAFPSIQVPSESIKGVDHLASCYINVFNQAFLAGTPEDLPYLDRMASAGEFPIALPPSLRAVYRDELRKAAELSAEMIRMRYGP